MAGGFIRLLLAENVEQANRCCLQNSFSVSVLFSYSRINVSHSWSVRRFDIHHISGSLREICDKCAEGLFECGDHASRFTILSLMPG